MVWEESGPQRTPTVCMNNMNTRYRLIFRGIRGGMYYCVDKTAGRRTNLQTTNGDEAQQIVEAKNQAERKPVLNLQIAKAFYQLAWHVGASQSDLAHLQAEGVDWQARIICFVRMKYECIWLRFIAGASTMRG